MEYSIVNMRLTKDAGYYKRQMEAFAEAVKYPEVTRVEFGKQDIRGGFSITLYNARHCVPYQLPFSSKEEMLGFIAGYNQRSPSEYDAFRNYGR